MTATPGTSTPQSFRGWSHARSLTEALSQAEAAVRARPQEAQARWLLFELLCVLGQWARALRQLQAWAGVSAGGDGTAHLMRGLIRAEYQRAEVLAGRATSATVTAPDTAAVDWMAGLGEALRLAAGDGSATEVDRTREAALAQAPDTPGRLHGHSSLPFTWLTDSDTRLGPVCEVILLGAYRWLPFADMASLRREAPTRLLDLVWSQADIVLRDGSALKGYLPSRYPVHAGDRDALLLGRETVWQDVGRSGVFARGQKMWSTDAGDVALLDVRQCDFGWPASSRMEIDGDTA